MAFLISLLDDNQGLVETLLDDNGLVGFLEAPRFALCPHVPSAAQMRAKGSAYRITRGHVVLCNQSGLSEVVSILEVGMKKLIAEVEQMIRKDD